MHELAFPPTDISYTSPTTATLFHTADSAWWDRRFRLSFRISLTSTTGCSAEPAPD
jgi:hypothetical protein